MVDVNEEKLNAAAQATYKMDYPGAMRVSSGLNLDPHGICRALYGKELNACSAELLGDPASGTSGLLSTHGLILDGTAGCWITTPDAAALDIISDIDMRIEYQPWLNGGGVSQTLISKWNSTGNQRSYKMFTVFGLLSIHWSNDGTADNSDGQVAPPSTARALRVTLDVVDGANHTSKGFSGGSIGLGSQFMTFTTGANTAIFNSTAVLGLGAAEGGAAENFNGRILRAEVRNGLDGTVVASPDFRNLASGTTSFVDSSGLTWTVQGTARIR